MGEAVDTIPSILNKCLFVSPDKPKAICSPLFQSWGHNNDPLKPHFDTVELGDY